MVGPDSPKESDTKRNGLLSDRTSTSGCGGPKENGFLSDDAEWHAFSIGLYDGLRTKKLRVGTELPDNPDVQKESHYYKSAFVIGTLLQLLVLALFAYITSGLF